MDNFNFEQLFDYKRAVGNAMMAAQNYKRAESALHDMGQPMQDIGMSAATIELQKVSTSIDAEITARKAVQEQHVKLHHRRTFDELPTAIRVIRGKIAQGQHEVQLRRNMLIEGGANAIEAERIAPDFDPGHLQSDLDKLLREEKQWQEFQSLGLSDYLPGIAKPNLSKAA